MTETSTASSLPNGYERRAVELPGTGRVLDTITFGSPSDAALVYHSGTPGGPAPLIPLAEAAAAAGLRYVAYSRPGYGQSTPMPGRTAVDACLDTRALLDLLGHEEFVTIGWSGGGPHALACGAVAADRCEAVAVVAGVAPFGAEGLNWLEGMGAENVAEFELALSDSEAFEAMLEETAVVMPQVARSELADALGDLVNDRDREAIDGPLGDYLHSSVIAAFESGPAGWRDDEAVFLGGWGFDVADVSVPTFVVQGSEDRMVPAAHGKWLAAHLDGALLSIGEGEGHVSIWERQLDSLIEFLSSSLR